MTHPLSKSSSYILWATVLAALPLIINWSVRPASEGSKTPQSSLQAKFSGQVVPGVVVIKMRAGISIPSGGLLKGSGREAELLKSAGVSSIQKAFPAAGRLPVVESNVGKVDISLIYFAKIADGQDPVAIARRLDQSGEFEYVEPKYMSRVLDTPNDPDYAANQASYFNQMNAPAGWAITKGDSNVVIADVDGGTYWQHPDLKPNVVGGWNFANNSNNPDGDPINTPHNYAHGTATASHFGAATNNGVGMAGSSWNCRLMPINASSPISDANGIEFGYEGIQYAYSHGAKIINCSWGRTGAVSRFEQDVIDAATQAGALVVAAAGNDTLVSDSSPEYPANYRNVLAVGATLSGIDSRAIWSNYGLTVPVYAPGTNIWSALTDGSTGNGVSGTSYASPLTAGLAGLVKSLHPTWTPRQIATQIRMTSDSIGPNLGHGRINFGRALTETHAGIEILSSSLLTPQGGKLFLPGDTVVLNMTVRNILFAPATGLSFFASASDAILQPLQGSTGSLTLAAGDSLVLPPLLFKVGSMSASNDVLVKLDWTDVAAGVNEHDAFAFKVRVFPIPPTWEQIQSPTFTGLWSICAVDKSTLWTAGGNGNATAPVVLRSRDSGTTWMDVTGNLTGVDLYCVNAIDSSRAWVGTGDGRIFATVDGGKSWSPQLYPTPQSPFIDGIKIFPDLSGFALGDPAAGAKFVVLTTTDGGSHWTHLTNEPVGLAGEAGWNNSFCWTDKTHGWFGTNDNTIWRTSDGGGSWLSGTTPEANSVAVSFGDNTHGMAGYPSGGLSVTTDGGATWSALTSPDSFAITNISYVPGTSYVWIADAGTPFMSTNRGGTWTSQITFPFDGSIYHGTFIDTTAGWMVTSVGEVLRYHASVSTSTLPPTSNLPVGYALEQNYPNPFNPTTTIRFLVPIRSRVRLTVYNILGEQIAEVVNKEFDAGSYGQVWGGALASGIYFYRIEATSIDNPGEKFVEVKKMLMIK